MEEELQEQSRIDRERRELQAKYDQERDGDVKINKQTPAQLKKERLDKNKEDAAAKFLDA